MKKVITVCLFFVATILASSNANAVMQRNPTGVNVDSTGPTTLVIRFTDSAGASFTTTEGIFCTEPADPVAGCAPGTVIGRLPAGLDRGSSRSSIQSTTDVMTIPYSVVRRALVSARSGANSDFFYVRRFDPVGGADIGNGAGVPVFVNVTCRMGPGTGRVPLSLTRVELYGEEPSDPRVRLIRLTKENINTGVVKADISFTGRGVLQGWWEVRDQADPVINNLDRFTEGALPEALRSQQRRYQRIKRFRVQVPLGGRMTLIGPRYDELPQRGSGRQEVLLRVDVTEDREQLSDLSVTGQSEQLFSGGAAGFLLETLEYWVSADLRDQDPLFSARVVIDESAGGEGTQLAIVWTPVFDAPGVRIDVTDDKGAEIAAIMAPAASGMAALPPAVVDPAQAPRLSFAVTVLGKDRKPVGESFIIPAQ